MSTLLRIVLCLTGAAIAVIGLNTALGGMATLGWQFPPFGLPDSSIDVARHDSNARFFAATFTGMGIAMALAGWRLKTFAPVAIAFLLAIALGGLSRIVQPGYSPLTDMALLPSLLAEIIAAPLLAFWTYRESRKL